MINRISRDYPAIPKIYPVDGIFGESTQQAVKKFQEIFSLTPDGVVGNATWYKMVLLYVGILDLAELVSQGQTFYQVEFNYPELIRQGDTGEKVRVLQYMLGIVSEFYSNVPPVEVDGIFGPATFQAVQAVQRMAGLNVDGIVGEATWGVLYRLYAGITDTVDEYTNVIPEEFRPDIPEAEATGLTQFPGRTLSLGDADRKDVSA